MFVILCTLFMLDFCWRFGLRTVFQLFDNSFILKIKIMALKLKWITIRSRNTMEVLHFDRLIAIFWVTNQKSPIPPMVLWFFPGEGPHIYQKKLDKSLDFKVLSHNQFAKCCKMQYYSWCKQKIKINNWNYTLFNE